MSKFFFTALGVGLVLSVAHDAYVTILHSRGRNGPISHILCRTVWRLARATASKLSRKRRHVRLNSIGPALMPTLIGVYITLLVFGFALIYYPHMATDFLKVPEAASPRWIESLYFSGVTLTTLGFGDIAPRTNVMRLVAVIESGAGFGLISLFITYLVAVYRALERRRTAALAFYHQADGSADVVGFIANHLVAGKLSGLAPNLRSVARDLEEMLESHIEHPIIHYFHTVEVYKSLPRVLFLSLETCAVIRSSIDREEHANTYERPEVRTLELSASHVLKELVSLLRLKKNPAHSVEPQLDESHRREARFDHTLASLEEAGIKTNRDREAGLKIYKDCRSKWEDSLFRLVSHLGYDWDEVTGDSRLLDAAERQANQLRVEVLK
ncbi:MAG TPA: potassium channel family protein [Blastocatellia bacterium]|nr:potassium channel family protein [Blastocatellia bacterium]